MKKIQKLGGTLFLAAVAILASGVAAQPASANCLAPVYHEDGSYAGFISCGSSAGNYMAVDGTQLDGASIDFLCDFVGVC